MSGRSVSNKTLSPTRGGAESSLDHLASMWKPSLVSPLVCCILAVASLLLTALSAMNIWWTRSEGTPWPSCFERGGATGATAGTHGKDNETHGSEEQTVGLAVKGALVCIAVSASILGELTYGLAISFMPIEMAYLGVELSWVSIIIAAYPIGMTIMFLMAPCVLRRVAPFGLINVSCAAQATTVLAIGALASVAKSEMRVFFIITFRLLFGMSCAISETVRVAMVLILLEAKWAPGVLALTMALRTLATSASPAIGAALYAAGGFTMPYLAFGVAFIAFFIAQNAVRCFVMRSDLLPVINGTNVGTLLSVPMVRVVTAMLFFFTFVLFMLDPIYTRTLSAAPYSMDTTQIGGYASILPAGVAIGMLAGSAFPRASEQLVASAATALIGLLFLGPVPGIKGSPALFAISSLSTGIGFGLLLAMCPAFLVVILLDNGLSKEDISGGLGALLFLTQMTGALFGPLVGGLLQNVDFPWLMLLVAIVMAVVYIPCTTFLLPYAESFGCLSNCLPGRAAAKEHNPSDGAKPSTRLDPTAPSILGLGAAFGNSYTTEQMVAAFVAQRAREGDTEYDEAFMRRVFEKCQFESHSVALPQKDLFRRMRREEYLEHRRTNLLGLAERAGDAALRSWRGDRLTITHLFWGTMTGRIEAPTLDISLLARLGLDHDVERTSIEGMGCLTGFRLLNLAAATARGDPRARILVIAADLRSALGNLMPCPVPRDLIVSCALFRDGASAAVVGGALSRVERPCYEIVSGQSRVLGRASYGLVSYAERDSGSVELRLSPDLPHAIHDALPAFVESLLAKVVASGFHPPPVDDMDIICHTGGPKVVREVAAALRVSEDHFEATMAVMRARGNLSGASNLAVLDAHYRGTGNKREWSLCISMGPGVCLEGVLLKRA